MIVVRLYKNNIKAAFESKIAFVLLCFKVKVVFLVFLIQKVLFFAFQSAKCGEILSIFSEVQSIAGINYHFPLHIFKINWEYTHDFFRELALVMWGDS